MPRAPLVHPRLAALRRATIALMLAATVVPAFAAAPRAPPTYSGFYADYSAMSLMRLTNIDRHALGRRQLKVDQYLVSLARDMPFTCPSNGNTYRGRARDMAARDYLSHAIRGCRTTSGGTYTIQNAAPARRLLDLHGREHRREQLAGHRRDIQVRLHDLRDQVQGQHADPGAGGAPSSGCGCAAPATARTS